MKEAKFAVGRRWRLNITDQNRFKPCYPFDFVILGEPEHFSKRTAVRCTLEMVGHTEKCGLYCHHGVTQDYPRKHLEKHATLVPLPIHVCNKCFPDHACDCGSCTRQRGFISRRGSGKCSTCGISHCCFPSDTKIKATAEVSLPATGRRYQHCTGCGETDIGVLHTHCPGCGSKDWLTQRRYPAKAAEQEAATSEK